MRTTHYTSLGLLLMLLLTGCGTTTLYSDPEMRLGENDVIAVLPLRALSGHPNGGAVMAELIEASLREAGGVGLVKQEEIRQKLTPLQATEQPVSELGQKLGATHLLTGTVTEYAYKRGPGEEPVVGVAVRLVHADTGRVLWEASLARTGRRGWVHEDSLSRVAQAVAEEVTQALLRNTTP